MEKLSFRWAGHPAALWAGMGERSATQSLVAHVADVDGRPNSHFVRQFQVALQGPPLRGPCFGSERGRTTLFCANEVVRDGKPYCQAGSTPNWLVRRSSRRRRQRRASRRCGELPLAVAGFFYSTRTSSRHLNSKGCAGGRRRRSGVAGIRKCGSICSWSVRPVCWNPFSALVR